MDTEPDEIIAARVQKGDSESFGQLITRYEAKLKRYGRKFLVRDDDIEDQVQEVFIKAYVHIKSFDTAQKFSPWIYRIAHNQFINEMRKMGQAPFMFFDPDILFPQLAGAETADRETLDRELSAALDASLSVLDIKYREPLVLYFYEDMSYQDIAEVLRIPVTTVGVRIKRGKEQLKKHYEKESLHI